METNILMEETAQSCSASVPIIDLSPLAQLEWFALIAVSVAVIWLAIRNLCTLSHGPLTAITTKTINSRISISQYALGILAAVWLLAMATSLQFSIMNFTMQSAEIPRATATIMARLNTQPPVTIGYGLVALTAIHGMIGILFVLRKKNTKDPE